MLAEVARLAAELSRPCSAGTEALLGPEHGGAGRAEQGWAGLPARRNATGCAGVREQHRGPGLRAWDFVGAGEEPAAGERA